MSVLLLFSSIASLTFDDENKNCCCLAAAFGVQREEFPRSALLPASCGEHRAQLSLETRRTGVTHSQATPTHPQCLLPAITHIAEAPVVLFLSPSQFQDFLCSDQGAHNPSSGAC